MTGLSLIDDNRQSEVATERAGGMVRGSLVARPNRHGLPHCLPDSDNDSERSKEVEFNEYLPMRKEGDHDEHHVNANILTFNGNLPIKEFLD